MRKVIEILMKEVKVSKAGNPYTITTILSDVGDEAEFFGTDIHIGDQVMIAFHWGKIKAIKPLTK